MTRDRALELAEAALHKELQSYDSPDTREALHVIGKLREEGGGLRRRLRSVRQEATALAHEAEYGRK